MKSSRLLFADAMTVTSLTIAPAPAQAHTREAPHDATPERSALLLRPTTLRCASTVSEEGGSVEIEMKADVTPTETRIRSIRASLQANGETGTFTRSINVEKALEYSGETSGRSMWISERNYGPRFRQVLVETPSQIYGMKSLKGKATLIENRSVLIRDLEVDCDIE